MAQFTVTVSDAELKALEWDILDIQTWVDNALHNKARRCIDSVVEEYSDKQARKMSVSEKETFILITDIPTAAERQAELESIPK